MVSSSLPTANNYKNSGDIPAAAVLSSSISGGLYPPLLLYHLSLGIIDVIAAEDVEVTVIENFDGFIGICMDIFYPFRNVSFFDDFACKVAYLGRHFGINYIFLIRRTIELVMPYENEGKVVETGADTGDNEIRKLRWNDEIFCTECIRRPPIADNGLCPGDRVTSTMSSYR